MNAHSARNWLKLSAIAGLLACGSGTVVAQGITVAMQAHFALSGFKQVDESTASSVKITNKDILNALNATGRFNFGSKAQIVFLSLEGELPSIAVREGNGTDAVTTDISDFFSITEPQEIHSSDHMHSYAIYVFNFDNQNGTSFSVSGLTLLHAGSITGPGIGTLTRDRTLNATVNGSGAIDSASMVVRGSVNGGSAKAEID
jgi:hypothetical protein